jgi:hypothetical protein
MWNPKRLAIVMMFVGLVAPSGAYVPATADAGLAPAEYNCGRNLEDDDVDRLIRFAGARRGLTAATCCALVLLSCGGARAQLPPSTPSTPPSAGTATASPTAEVKDARESVQPPAPAAPPSSAPAALPPPASPLPAATAPNRPVSPVTPTTLFLTVVVSKNGELQVATLATARCEAIAQRSSGDLVRSGTLTPDDDGNVFWRYTPFSGATGTGTHTISCTAGDRTVQATRDFAIP